MLCFPLEENHIWEEQVSSCLAFPPSPRLSFPTEGKGQTTQVVASSASKRFISVPERHLFQTGWHRRYVLNSVAQTHDLKTKCVLSPGFHVIFNRSSNWVSRWKEREEENSSMEKGHMMVARWEAKCPTKTMRSYVAYFTKILIKTRNVCLPRAIYGRWWTARLFIKQWHVAE